MKVLFFAHLRQITREESIELYVSQAVTVDQFWQLLGTRFPALIAHRPHVRLAKNCEYVSAGDRFSNFDEIALIPPVSGG
jgi:molybdopterin converting factor subunit 1